MGPGSFDPGNLRLTAVILCALAASMGPGSFDPGNDFGGGHWSCSRKASMGPGSFDPGNERHRTRRMGRLRLQWGRGLSTPEIRQTRTHCLEYPSASMGPGSFDPGNAIASATSMTFFAASMGPGSFDPGNANGEKHIAPYCGLQWGRGLSTPEIGRDGRSGNQPQGFNGAGVFRPRKCDKCDDF